jgi:hypothetical protein
MTVVTDDDGEIWLEVGPSGDVAHATTAMARSPAPPRRAAVTATFCVVDMACVASRSSTLREGTCVLAAPTLPGA